jgi:SAM-dependent methyltransferase
MQGYDRTTYGERVASVYDDMHPGVLPTDGSVQLLTELAGPGPLLELGVGTGRLAIPLAERGVEVHGIDCSPAMLARLAAKPGGQRVRTVLGDLGEVDLGVPCSVVVIAADTLFMLASQDEQVHCFATASRHLTDDGVFVVDVFVPDKTGYGGSHGLVVRKLTADSIVLGAAVFEPVGQRMEGQQIVLSATGATFAPAVLRYAWPAELDLMARLAGLRLRDRWGGWRREPFTAASTRHVSVYERC